MTLEQAFELINNLDVREPLRKFAPQWATVFVDATGKIVDVIRFKQWPKPSGTLHEHFNQHPGTVKFITQPGLYGSLDKLREKIADCIIAHQKY
ncbi:MAG: hypothetical protein QOJ02_842 [Acidobacteriota bacterium]|jgi:hypothetical protein|nr:hypothetical protein [Acidobacteriota bacterium]